MSKENADSCTAAIDFIKLLMFEPSAVIFRAEPIKLPRIISKGRKMVKSPFGTYYS